MKLKSKLAWGAAWTGLALVVLVPSADYLTNGAAPTALITSDTDPVQASTGAPTAAPSVKTASLTEPAGTPTITVTPRMVSISPATTTPPTSGTKLAPTPMVTVGGAAIQSQAAAASKPQVVQATGEETETKTASLGLSATNPPFPAPLSQRPKEILPTVDPTPVGTVTPQVATLPKTVAPADEPLIIDETKLPKSTVASNPARPTPPAGIANDPERESLSTYLERRGLLDDGRSSASITYMDANSDYDPDGFYLSDGPNNDLDNMTPRQRRRWLLAHGVDPDSLEPF